MASANITIDLTNSDSENEARRNISVVRPPPRSVEDRVRAGPVSLSNQSRHPLFGFEHRTILNGSSSTYQSPQHARKIDHKPDTQRLPASSHPAGAMHQRQANVVRDNWFEQKRRERQHVRAPNPNVCINCAEVHVTCDGERPCSACVEPGLACCYPNDKLLASKVGPPPGTTATKSSIASTKQHQYEQERLPSYFKTSIRSAQTTQQSDLVPNQLLATGKANSNQSTGVLATADKEEFQEIDESDDEDVPLAIIEFEQVKQLLKTFEERMRDHRKYLLQPLLNQCRLDATKAPTPYRKPEQANPFISLIGRIGTSCAGNHNTPTLTMHAKSHKVGASKKWSTISAPLKHVDTDATILPKYKSIGRLGTSLLAPNIRTLKYWPYFPDEENLDASEAKKNEELEERYQHDDNHLLAQRKCSELVDMWQPWVKDFVSKLRIEFSDILYWFLHTADKTTCDTCERDILAEAFSDVIRLLNKPPERSLLLAQHAAMAVKDLVKVSMWHFVLGAPSVKDITAQTEPLKKAAPTLCLVCFVDNCLSHGAFLEPEESGGAVIMGGNVEINDEEPNHNIRLPAAIPSRSHEGVHQCGLYCVGAEVRIKDILGRRKDGKIGGIHNHTTHVPRLSIGNDIECSENCYWPVEKRTKFGSVQNARDYQPKMLDESRHLFQQLLRIHADNQRAPCIIAKYLGQMACIDAFYYMLAEMQRVSHYRQAAVNAAHQNARKVSRLASGLDTTMSAELDDRPPFIPCSHNGSCLNNPECTCAQNRIHCEWFCGCDKSCERRFPGCKCASTNKTCFNDKNCECWKHNRECDPWLCGSCGVIEVLDPQNKYRSEIRRGRCKNNRIQLELPARTIKAPSEVQGWGLYAGTDMEENAFIGEYKGETVGNQESDRRGAVYANIGQEYLFVMNRDQQIDGSNFGNKTRFINNSQRDDYINVYAKKLLCNGVQRVMLYSKRSIKAGEELLYNYNYPVSVTKKFWERGEGPTNTPGAVVAKPSITWTQPRVNGRFARVAGKQDGEQSIATRVESNGETGVGEDDSLTRRDVKRKRASGIDVSFPVTERPLAVKDSGEKHTGQNGLPFPDDPDDSDFELIEASESSESVNEAEGDPDQAEGSTRRRMVHPNDRRRGGLAQAKAWETRRKRTGRGK